MDVDKSKLMIRSEEGQSILEFVLMLPVMIGFIAILLRINTVVQMSIVNQQYARAQALTLTYNSSIYPLYRLRFDNFNRIGSNRMIIGVAENASPSDSDEPYIPVASTQMVSRTENKSGGDGPLQSEPQERGKVRVRTAVSLCTQVNVLTVNGQKQPLGPNGLTETMKPSFCISPQDG